MTKYEVSIKQDFPITHACRYVVVWCPKYRRPVLTEAIAARLRALIETGCDTLGAELVHLHIAPDNVVLQVGLPPQVSVHRMVRFLKGRSSAVLRQEFPALRSRLSTLWTHAYFVATLGGTPPEVIPQYVAAQKYV